jgi:multisite-specific tRNA:(cytosine-C5)-methyltransferase
VGAERGIKNHRTQLALLLKALELVKVGGRVVYSTCSLNPIENEAVIAAALRWGAVEREWVKMVDVGHELRALKRLPGLSEWRVPDRQNASTVYASFQDVRPSRKDLAAQQAGGVTEARVEGGVDLEEVRRGLMASMFAPDPPRSMPQQQDPLNLRRAVRILPHLQVCAVLQ